ncbi:MAG TPA: hypothetical protein VN577_07245 [Terriglobales bacterium]|nr:hypothetical protein [Terriglobales bacterium]
MMLLLDCDVAAILKLMFLDTNDGAVYNPSAVIVPQLSTQLIKLQLKVAAVPSDIAAVNLCVSPAPRFAPSGMILTEAGCTDALVPPAGVGTGVDVNDVTVLDWVPPHPVKTAARLNANTSNTLVPRMMNS